MTTYRTYFNLTAPVINFDDAKNYLQEDDMTDYLRRDSRFPKTLDGKDIISIDWILRTESSGYIELITNRKLTKDELDFISDWISGQNSDGIGEGFEQQDFACYSLNDDNYYDDYDDNWIMAEFDWQTNDYGFELISSD